MKHPPSRFLREEGSNIIHLFSVLTLFEPKLVSLYREVSGSWCKIDACHAATIQRALDNQAFPLSIQEKRWLVKASAKNLQEWEEEWIVCKEINPFLDDQFDQKKEWRMLTMVMTFGFLNSPLLYQSRIEPWALSILEEWKTVILRYRKDIVDPEPIYFFTHLIFCSSHYGSRNLTWSKKIKRIAMKITDNWMTSLKNPLRNIEPFLELGICKVILGGDGCQLRKFLMDLYLLPIKQGRSKFQHWSGGRNARHTDYHIHILVALFWLLDRKTASKSLLSEEVRAKEL